MPDLMPVDAGWWVRTVLQDRWRACVELRGEIDLAGAPDLERHLGAHLRAGRRFLRVDTGQLEFIDCTALAVLVRADRTCRARHGSLILGGASVQLRRLLSLALLDEVLLVETAEPLVGGAVS